jgi:pilus assembly protein CpaF
MNAHQIVAEGPSGCVVRHTWSGANPLWLGRDPSCDLLLESELISRRHAVLTLTDGKLLVEDHSVNGTLVDGASLHLARRAVASPAVLEIGPYRLQVRREPDAPPPGASAALRRQLQRRLLDHLDLARVDRTVLDPKSLRPKVVAALELLCATTVGTPRDDATRRALIDELADEALGLGPLERLLADAEVSEIMVVDRDTIYVERRGLIERTDLRFTDDDAVRSVIERIVTPLGRRIDESTPLVDARLADGSRVNAVIPPLAGRGPCITIRKFPQIALGLDDLVARGSLTARMARFLACAVKARKNVIISGGTGSGKTTLLNVLSQAIPEQERIVTIEDAAELRLQQQHVVSLEARPANLEGKGAYTIRDLVRNALRMRPDRIIVGECRGGEAIDMLQAMNTGHEGSMTTTHANSPTEAVARLETLCMMAGLDLPMRAIRQQLAQSVHLIVQQSRFADGTRRVVAISEVAGIDDHGDVQLREVFAFARTGLDAEGRVRGVFRASGSLPSFASELFAQGLDCFGGEA